MKCDPQISILIHDFFYKRLKQQEVSPNTIKTYRDGIKLFLLHITQNEQKEAAFPMLTAENIIEFLEEYSCIKKVSERTYNQRLAILKSLAKYAIYEFPENANELMRINQIRFKREKKKLINYLEKFEMECLLKQPDQCSANGFKHYAILLFMYNTGARVSEVVSLNIEQLDIHSTKSVTIRGKGNKERIIPLWDTTIEALKKVIDGRESLYFEPVFLNRQKKRLTRRGITCILAKYIQITETICPSLMKKTISPHSIRHSTAMHMLQSGVDMNTIRLLLGHVSIATTNVYIELDLEMKKKALMQVNIKLPHKHSKKWEVTNDILNFLDSL